MSQSPLLRMTGSLRRAPSRRRAPSGAGQIEPVLDQVPTSAFDDAGGDRPAVGQCGGIVEVPGPFWSGTVRSRWRLLRAALGRWRLVAVRRIAPATFVACPASLLDGIARRQC